MCSVFLATHTWRSSCQSQCRSVGRMCGCRSSLTETACSQEARRTTCQSRLAPAAKPAQSAARRDGRRFTRNALRVRRQLPQSWFEQIFSLMAISTLLLKMWMCALFQRRAVWRARGWCVMTPYQHQGRCRRLSSPQQCSERTDQQNTWQTQTQSPDQRTTLYTSE